MITSVESSLTFSPDSVEYGVGSDTIKIGGAASGTDTLSVASPIAIVALLRMLSSLDTRSGASSGRIVSRTLSCDAWTNIHGIPTSTQLIRKPSIGIVSNMAANVCMLST